MKLINKEESENFTVDIEVEDTHSYQLDKEYCKIARTRLRQEVL